MAEEHVKASNENNSDNGTDISEDYVHEIHELSQALEEKEKAFDLLSQHIEEYKQGFDLLNTKVASLEDKNKEQEKQLKDLRQQKDGNNQKVGELEKTIESLKAQNAKLVETQIEQLNKMKKEHETKNQETEDKRKDLDKMSRDLEAKNEELQKRNKHLENINKEFESMHNKLETYEKDIQMKTSEHEKIKKEYQNKIRCLEEDNKAYLEQNNSLEQKVKNLEQASNNVSQQKPDSSCQAIENKLADALTVIHERDEALLENRNILAQATSELELQLKKKEELSKNLQDVKQKMHNIESTSKLTLQNELDKLAHIKDEEHSKTRKLVDEKVQQINRLNSKVDDLNKELESIKTELNDQKGKCQSLDEALKQKNKELDDQKAQFSALDDSLKQNNREHDDQKARFQALDEAVKQKNKELGYMKAKMLALQQELEQERKHYQEHPIVLQINIRDIVYEVPDDTLSKIESLEYENNNLSVQLKEREEQIRTMRSTTYVKSLEYSNQLQQNRLNDLSRELQVLKTENAELQTKVTKLEEFLKKIPRRRYF